MQRLPGARMALQGARAQGAVAWDILWPVRARAHVSRSKLHKIRAPQRHFEVKMGTKAEAISEDEEEWQRELRKRQLLHS